MSHTCILCDFGILLTGEFTTHIRNKNKCLTLFRVCLCVCVGGGGGGGGVNPSRHVVTIVIQLNGSR